MVNETTYSCSNCQKDIIFNVKICDWEHVGGGGRCGAGKLTYAAPVKFNRCIARQRKYGGWAQCERPVDGHTKHCADVVNFFDSGKAPITLDPFLRWVEES